MIISKNIEMNSKIKFIIVVFGVYVTNTHCELTSVVETDKGPIQGEIRKTIENSVKFSSFRGIPYGKPPVGRLRFMPPVEAESWSDIFNATTEATPCPQIDFVPPNNYIGSEDCLNLNVYTPKINFRDGESDLLAVMIWVTGGAYRNGYTNITYLGPDYLIENDVVVVMINFRVGALGHLALNLENATGNAALKDQRLAFKWVKRNIEAFGGDPNRVTIFGISSGGTSVDFHVLSDSSRGLFHRSISMSASSLCAWASATMSEMKSQAFYLGRLLGIHTNDTLELLTAMYDIPAEDIVKATSKMMKSNLRPFKPVIEDPDIAGASTFMSEFAIKKYKNGNFSHLPHMTGFLASEALLFLTSLSTLKAAADKVQQQSALMMADIPLGVISELSSITGGLPQSVVGDMINKMVAESITNLTDILYISPIDSKQKFMQKFSPVYYYKTTVTPEVAHHKYRGTPSITGAAHADDVPYLWHSSVYNYPTNPNDPFVITRNRLTRMWTNFAKYSDPTPHGNNDLLLNVTWPVSGPDGNYLEINHVLTVGNRPIDALTKKIEAAFISDFETFSECT